MEIKIWCLGEDSFLVYVDKDGSENSGFHFTGEQLLAAFSREFQQETVEAFRSSASTGSTATITWFESHSMMAPKPHDGSPV